ncbi:TPA: hypothetical protein DD449_00375 [Candidatus Berkelbacteria bacterium]|uniref:Uncharacterized protein n=1 Tax=Berkelbacteria bacterium GW2011_GWE1_39_12 TaxID=1618337 RepID=A0A0G4B728_9BACT|nr:MAG: hypothetical protein UT28_C0001G1013 [Berkelbacteria bacterium GW2011_GWE1_39_12]HBO60129.1 hypothetical protein [Candidatus Berkelbacteria bacterium]
MLHRDVNPIVVERFRGLVNKTIAARNNGSETPSELTDIVSGLREQDPNANELVGLIKEAVDNDVPAYVGGATWAALTLWLYEHSV